MRFYLLIFTCFFALACSANSGNKPAFNENEGGAATSVFPHQDNWSEPEQHGVWVNKSGYQICLKCHSSNSTDKNASFVACTSCHPLFPHIAGWKDKGGHGTEVMSKGFGTCSTKCHGADLRGGLSNTSCYQCHADFPHEKNFAETHGQTLITANPLSERIEACKLCHGDDFTGGTTGKSCYRCHTSFPHPAIGESNKENFAPWLAKHGEYFADKEKDADSSCATAACHGSDLAGNPANVPVAEKLVKGCNDCHLQMPHQDDWDHGKSSVDEDGLLDLSKCTSCHEDNLRGNNVTASCYQCHNNYPAPHRNSELAANSAWTSNSGHGETVHQAAQGKSGSEAATTAGCATCHGADFKGGASGKSCYTCHASYPHQNHFADHAELLMAKEPLSEQMEPCKLCHGANLTGGENAPSCFSCHPSFPHPVPESVAGDDFAPWLSKHGDYFASKENQNASSCAEAECHGTDLRGNPADVAPALKKVPGCSDCHLQMPHQQEAWDHGRSVVDENGLLNLSNCTECHEDNLRGNDVVASCYQCHNNYPAPHRSDDLASSAAWTSGGEHAQTLRTQAPDQDGKLAAQNAGCSICHGNELTGGTSGKSCYSCHQNYPHINNFESNGQTYGEWGSKAGHGTYVKTKALQSDIQTIVGLECASCHENPAAGSRAKKCTECHDPQDQYPHTENWYDAANEFGGSHGATVGSFAKTAAASAAGCLTACHGSDGQSGFVNPSAYCSTCHEKYPHLSNTWKENDLGLAEHAASVLNTFGTESKNDDTFNAEKFAECSGCHGDDLTFESNRFDLLPEEVSTLLDGQPQVDRCYACHRYPHNTVRGHTSQWPCWDETDGAIYNWGPKPGRYSTIHPEVICRWNYFGARLPQATFVQRTCGEVNGEAGCHSNGPVSPNWRRDEAECVLCHPGPQ